MQQLVGSLKAGLGLGHSLKGFPTGQMVLKWNGGATSATLNIVDDFISTDVSANLQANSAIRFSFTYLTEI